jgi:hypothetical protein
MLGDGRKMKLDMDPFLVSLVDLVEKNILVHFVQANTTRAKNVIILDEMKHWMRTPHNPEFGVRKENAF